MILCYKALAGKAASIAKGCPPLSVSESGGRPFYQEVKYFRSTFNNKELVFICRKHSKKCLILIRCKLVSEHVTEKRIKDDF